jgi:hypothetical protein
MMSEENALGWDVVRCTRARMRVGRWTYRRVYARSVVVGSVERLALLAIHFHPCRQLVFFG